MFWSTRLLDFMASQFSSYFAMSRNVTKVVICLTKNKYGFSTRHVDVRSEWQEIKLHLLVWNRIVLPYICYTGTINIDWNIVRNREDYIWYSLIWKRTVSRQCRVRPIPKCVKNSFNVHQLLLLQSTSAFLLQSTTIINFKVR